MGIRHTYDLGVIGNCSYLAYINKTDANVSWMCLPRFDSSFIFGSLLDNEKGGEFSIKPEGRYENKQYYQPNTNILCTEFSNGEGSIRITDFAPRFFHFERNYKPLMLIRKIEPLSGNMKLKVKCNPVGNYGEKRAHGTLGSNHIHFSGLDEQVRLTTDIPLNYIQEEQYFYLSKTRYLVLTWGQPLEAPLESTVENFLSKTRYYWLNWIKDCRIGRFWQNEVIRSALILKIHQYEDTGAIIASGTTSLPESPNSTRNWDYRFCWMRDSYYTLKALYDLGHFEELEKYSTYIENIAINDKNRYNPVYNISGRDDFEERILPLKGYLGNQPVRVGNQAKEHIQNDVYGQILVSLLPLYVDNRLVESEGKKSYKLIHYLLDCIETTMDEPDAGLWEFRNKSQKHCYTFLFHWAGSSAAAVIGKNNGDEKLYKRALKLKKAAATQIESCYDPKRKLYTQAAGIPHLDASLLQMVTMNYLKPDSIRAKQHIKGLEESLKTPEGLFYRYKNADDFGSPESTFFVCAFWYTEALASVGEVEKAAENLDKLIKYSNHLGLFSEDVDASNGSQWGNFPQTYSHVGLINSAFRITNRLDLPEFL